jgi:hypothetical protein
MAQVFTKSAALIAMDASGQAPSARVSRGAVHAAYGMVALANGDSIASIIRMCRVPSNCRVARIYLKVFGTITGAAGDIGVYRYSKETTSAGAVVDVDLFASAQALSTAIPTWTDVTNESATITPLVADQPLWQMAGLTSDPGEYLEIAITLTAAAAAAGNVAMEVVYVE